MNKIVLTITFLLVAFFVQAGPLWMRYPKISPDGKQIAFSYKGDIYVVPAGRWRGSPVDHTSGV